MHRTPSVLIWLSHRPHIGHFPSLVSLTVAGLREAEAPPVRLPTAVRRNEPWLTTAGPRRLLPAHERALRGPAPHFGVPVPPAPGPTAISLRPPPPSPRPSPWRRAGPAWRCAGGARGGSHLPRRRPAGRGPGAVRTPQPRCWV